MEGFNCGKKQSLYFCFMLFICLSIIIICGSAIAADKNSNQNQSKTASAKLKSCSSYCGVYCLYAVMKLSDQKVNFQELVKPEYIGSRKGSSLAELKKATEDYGLYAVPTGKLTRRELRNCPYPVILHVKSEIESGQYDHYELFLGIENSQARIFDPPNPVRLVSFAELAPRWSGNGLIVSAESIDLSIVFAPARKRFMLYASIIIACILAFHWAKRLVPVTLLNTRIKFTGLSIA